MATYYLKTVSGNNANDGSSLALAKQTLAAFQGLITAGDIIRIDAAESVTTPAKLATGVGTSFPSVMITTLTTDSINAKLEVTRGTTASPIALFTTGTHYFSKMDILTIYNSSTVTNSFFGNNSIGSGIFRNCTITAKQLNASVTSLVNPLPTLTLLDVENCVIDGSNKGSSNYYFRINGLPSGSKLIKNKFINIRVVDESSNAFLNLTTAGVIFSYNIVEAIFASTALSVLIKLNTLSCYVYKNTILLTSAASANNRAAFSYSAGGVINYGQVYDNIIYYNDVNAPYYIYGAGAGYTITNPETIPNGNNVAYGQTGIVFNLTNFQENYGALVTLSGNPFLSLSNSSSDFLKIDISAAASSAVINAGYFDPDSNIGFDGVDPGAGSAPNAYDLRAGVTVGAVTGTLVVPAVADVRAGVNFGVNNAEIGLLDLPAISDVKAGVVYDNTTKTGTYLAYPLLPANRVQFGYDRGDGSIGTDKGELFNDAITSNELAIGVSKQNIGNTIVGTYNASERYTFIPEDKVEINFDYLFDAEEFTGTFAGGGATDYPSEEKVLYPTTYAFGLKIGKLGYYSNTNINIIKEMQDNALLVMTNILGADFTQLKYFKEPEKNDFYHNTKQYGIRAMDIDQLKDVVGKDTNDVYYEIKLTTDFDNRDADDAERDAELYLIEQMTAIRLQLKETKFGRDPRVRIVRDFTIDECEKLSDRVILCRAVILVSYRT